MTALSHVTGDFAEAVKVSGEVLAIRGTIFPTTLENVSLEALMMNGKIVLGETRIAKSGNEIRRLSLRPRRVRPLPEVLEAIQHADLILIGPGSLYTSILPNLLVSGVAEAIEKSSATPCAGSRISMTQPGRNAGVFPCRIMCGSFIRTRGANSSIGWSRATRAFLRKWLDDTACAEPSRFAPTSASLQRLGVRCLLDHLLEEHGVVRHNAGAPFPRLLIEEFVERRPPAK